MAKTTWDDARARVMARVSRLTDDIAALSEMECDARWKADALVTLKASAEQVIAGISAAEDVGRSDEALALLTTAQVDALRRRFARE